MRRRVESFPCLGLIVVAHFGVVVVVVFFKIYTEGKYSKYEIEVEFCCLSCDDITDVDLFDSKLDLFDSNRRLRLDGQTNDGATTRRVEIRNTPCHIAAISAT